MDTRAPSVALVVAQASSRARSLLEYLAQESLRVVWEDRGDRAYENLAKHAPDLVFIEAEAPGLGAKAFCRQVREDGNPVPVIVIAETSDVFDHVVCLEMGADDYVGLEVPGRLLWARARAVLRRALLTGPAARGRDVLRFGELILDRSALEVRLRGEVVRLTSTEFACIWMLAERAGTVVSREDLRGLAATPRQGASPRTVDTQISRLRRKLDRVDPAFNRIKSVRLLGYLFSPSPV